MFDSFTGPVTDRRKVVLGLLFASAAGVAAWRRPRIRLDYLGPRKLDDIVPNSIGAWNFVTASGLVVPPEDQLARAIYSQMLTRVYSDGQTSPIMLLMAQSAGQTGFLQIHRPEICYTAGGYQISAVTPHPITIGSKAIQANLMDASSGERTEHVVYWTRVGNKMPLSWTDQKLAVAQQNLEGIIPDAILVRLSCVSDDREAALAAIDKFTRAMIASIPANMRAVLIA